MRSSVIVFLIWAVLSSCVQADNNENEEFDKRGKPTANRISSIYSFGLGKRPYSNYNFGLGKRATADVIGAEDLLDLLRDELYEDTTDYDIEKRNSKFNFGLGKRYSNSKINSKFNFGLGKRASIEEGQDVNKHSRFGFGLGKREVDDWLIKPYGQEEAEEQDGNSLMESESKRSASAYAMIQKPHTYLENKASYMGKRGKNSQNYPFLGKRLPIYDFGLGKRSSN